MTQRRSGYKKSVSNVYTPAGMFTSVPELDRGLTQSKERGKRTSTKGIDRPTKSTKSRVAMTTTNSRQGSPTNRVRKSGTYNYMDETASPKSSYEEQRLYKRRSNQRTYK